METRERPAWLSLRLAGATWRDRIFAGFGAVLGVCLTGAIAGAVISGTALNPLVVAPIGASAVLLFAVPSSPLAQPWSIVGGNVVSALVGWAIGQSVHDLVLAIGLAVGVAILVMSLLRCLHPPGGAVALMAVMATSPNGVADFFHAFLPVGVNSVLLVGLGWLFHRFTRHSYPHVPAPLQQNLQGGTDVPRQNRLGFRAEDIDAVLADLHETFDIGRNDLELLLRQVELRVYSRCDGPLTCADIMLRDVICIMQNETLAAARARMKSRSLRCLPVVNRVGILVGLVTSGDAIGGDALVASAMREPLVASPEQKVMSLVAQMASGVAHQVVVTDPDRRVLGLITQTDLVAAMARSGATG